MSAKALQKSARKAERDEKLDVASDLYSELICSFPDSEEAREAKFDLEELKKKKEMLKRCSDEKSINVNPGQNKNMNNNDGIKVIINDVSMSFMSMVVFMVKWAIASIPAIIILAVIGAMAVGIFGGIIGGMMRF